ncbi:outer membrane protein [Escherichia coli]|uniref:Outer membrane protein n=1 Tax=Escherichia coli TaxID=562 RepID=A0A376VMT6_ECOLX|nr:outer membrane protein [Escherichia coli]
MALSPDEKTLLIPGMVRGDIVRINTITHQKKAIRLVMRVERYRRCVFDLKTGM